MTSRTGTDWGICSKHCSLPGGGTSRMLEAKLDFIKGRKCDLLGKSSGE